MTHRYPQRPLLLAPRLGDVVSADRLRLVSPLPQTFTESPQILVEPSLVHRDRDMIDPGGTSVGGDLTERLVEGRFGGDLVDQAEPLASLDPLFEGRQHPPCPDQRFHPGPSGRDVSGTFSPGGHCRRLGFRDRGHCVSTSLHPFAPPALPGFVATMGALTPARRLFVSLSGTMNSAWTRAGLPASRHRTVRSFRLQPPTVVPTRCWGFASSGLPDHTPRR